MMKNMMNKEFQNFVESHDSSEDDENADGSIRFNLDFDSNEIDESDSHDEKHSEQRISTLRGITID
jgi:hypothetical protein